MFEWNFINVLGLIAGALTTLSLLPQVIKTVKTKSTEDLSLGMFTLMCFGLLLWLIYGFYIQALPVIISNTLTLILALIILFYKIKYH